MKVQPILKFEGVRIELDVEEARRIVETGGGEPDPGRDRHDPGGASGRTPAGAGGDRHGRSPSPADTERRGDQASFAEASPGTGTAGVQLVRQGVHPSGLAQAASEALSEEAGR